MNINMAIKYQIIFTYECKRVYNYICFGNENYW